jgi:tetratricopeptide (TPR) repeat protein
VNKTFSEILAQAPWFTEDQAQQLAQWAGQYPYAQALQVAAACAAWHHNWPDKQERLQHAAVCTANRGVLKEWIKKAETRMPSPASEPTPPNIADILMADIEQLRLTMKRFEEVAGQAASSLVVKTIHPAKTKKQRLLEAVAELNQAQQTDKPSAETGTSASKNIKSRRKKRKAEPDTLLEELQSRQVLEPENHNTREQLEIIDRFIQKNPSVQVSPPAGKSEPAPDLASTTLPADFTEHIVSETLVDILIQQGKKDKAIEVLKKLIWKFPQKKMYFAARIDELKK